MSVPVVYSYRVHEQALVVAHDKMEYHAAASRVLRHAGLQKKADGEVVRSIKPLKCFAHMHMHYNSIV